MSRLPISIHALLAESDGGCTAGCDRRSQISIHALLAESDGHIPYFCARYTKFLSTLSLRRATDDPEAIGKSSKNFYPRSPYGERRCWRWEFQHPYHFYPRSPYGERHSEVSERVPLAEYFYPRSPYGERLSCLRALLPAPLFLSTLSLRRATCLPICRYGLPLIFLSTLSLRRATTSYMPAIWDILISIHALLTESDKMAKGGKLL